MVGDEVKTDKTHITVATKSSTFPRKHSRSICGKNKKAIPLLLTQQFLDKSNHMLSTKMFLILS